MQSDPTNPYRIPNAGYVPSKTALNAITVAFANELDVTQIKANAACPGFTATDLNQHRGIRSVELGAREAVRLALLDESGPTGGFSNEFGCRGNFHVALFTWNGEYAKHAPFPSSNSHGFTCR